LQYITQRRLSVYIRKIQNKETYNMNLFKNFALKIVNNSL
jgi:hypothetical protein